MNIASRAATIIGALAIAALGACGGGGSDGPAPVPGAGPTGGISGNGGIAVGPISTFGSIVVNGVRYDTSSTTFTIDGEPANEDDFGIGQIVLVEGTINADGVTGSADTVTSDDDVTGPVESIDLALGQLVVLGQLVIVEADTSFDDNISPASLEGLAVGDIVEVSGFFTANGDISASRIEKKPAGSQLEVHGTVSNLDAAAMTFSINSLVVDYSSAMLNDFPSGQISDGDFVEAKGDALGGAGELIATIVELENVGFDADDGTHVEIEGFITRFVSATDFDVSGIPVTTNSGTVFEGGAASDLGLNIKVEVEGELDANGTVVAEEVDIRRSKAVRVTAVVDSVDPANDSLVMLGITFTTDELTRFEDKSDADIRPLTIADLNAGDYLEIRGAEFPAGSGQVLAALLERDDPDTETELQGFVESVTQPAFSILGVTVETNSSTEFRDENDNAISANEFFNRVDVNTLVEADGTETGDTTITAEEVELEFE